MGLFATYISPFGEGFFEAFSPLFEIRISLLLRVLTTSNGSRRGMDKFSCRNTQSSELQTFIWLNATVIELTSLVKISLPRS